MSRLSGSFPSCSFQSFLHAFIDMTLLQIPYQIVIGYPENLKNWYESRACNLRLSHTPNAIYECMYVYRGDTYVYISSLYIGHSHCVRMYIRVCVCICVSFYLPYYQHAAYFVVALEAAPCLSAESIESWGFL